MENKKILIEVNGVKYEPIQRENNRINKKPSRLAQILLTTSLMYMPYLNDLYTYGTSSNQRKLPDNIDIIKEYGLIQNKESKLSRWERDAVVRIFEYNYKIIE